MKKLNNSNLFVIISCFFVAILLISNIAAQKLIPIGPFIFTGGILLFPFSYIFGDILTEVWGYSKSRIVIYLGFICSIFMAIFFSILVKLPPAPNWEQQEAFSAIFGFVPRIVLGSMVAYFCGEFLNSFVVSKLKVKSEGKNMGFRFVISTIIGESADTIIFVLIALYGTLPNEILLTTAWSGILFKVVYEIIALPFTIKLVKWLKKTAGTDVYDNNTNYNPFSFKDEDNY